MLDHLVQKMALEGRIDLLHATPAPRRRGMGLRVAFGIVVIAASVARRP